MYKYEDHKPSIFTEDGVSRFLKIRDRVHKVLNQAGAITLGSAIRGASGDSWTNMACVDHLVEMGEIREVMNAGSYAQDRIFVSCKTV